MAWHRLSKAPHEAGSRTWLGQDDGGRTALLREVPQGVTVSVDKSATPGIVWLREVVVVDGVRMSVWDLVEATSLGELTDVSVSRGKPPALSVLVRIIVDAATALSKVKPARPHGGLSDDVLLVDESGQTHVMDFGLPRPSRFSPPGPPSLRQDAATLAAVLRSCAPASKETPPPGFEQVLSTSFDDVAGLARALTTVVPHAMPHEVAAFVHSCRSGGRAVFNETRDDLVSRNLPIPTGTQPGQPPEAFISAPHTRLEPGLADTVMRARDPLLEGRTSDEPFGVERTVAVSQDFDSDAARTVFAGPSFRPPDGRDDRTVAQRPSNVKPAALADFSEDSGAFVFSDRTVALPAEPLATPARPDASSVPLGASDDELVRLEAPAKPSAELETVEARTRRPAEPETVDGRRGVEETVDARRPKSSKAAPARTGDGTSKMLVVLAVALAAVLVALIVLVWKHRTAAPVVTRYVRPVRIVDGPDASVEAFSPLADAGLDEDDDSDAGPDDDGEDDTVDAGSGQPRPKSTVPKKKKKKRRHR